ncbi:hypothetical protein C7441_11222 [Pseudaminobacter salicylatoxidans]|uniref:Uncharacterized protein n=1 Tax=Pseudaminobacter salicylatoxidans TaxID=93369 RepID=A0A316C404_PSESE|nr:hypothetical protein C7441_11222 [Pseudaminobacter salicylatoxidans]
MSGSFDMLGGVRPGHAPMLFAEMGAEGRARWMHQKAENTFPPAPSRAGSNGAGWGSHVLPRDQNPRLFSSRRNRPSGSAEGFPCAGLSLVYEAPKGCFTESRLAVASAAVGVPSMARLMASLVAW